MEEIIEPSNPTTQTQQPPRKPDNYLPWAILTTLLCCLPFGVVAIVYSARVDSEWNAGRYDAAIEAAASAKKWTWIGFGVGLSVYILYALFVIGVGVMGLALATGVAAGSL